MSDEPPEPGDLADSTERLRAILDTAIEAIITIDERGRIESANPATERLFGFSAAEMIGQNVSMLMPSPDRERHAGYLANYLRTGDAKIIGIGREVVCQRRDGTLRAKPDQFGGKAAVKFVLGHLQKRSGKLRRDSQHFADALFDEKPQRSALRVRDHAPAI